MQNELLFWGLNDVQLLLQMKNLASIVVIVTAAIVPIALCIILLLWTVLQLSADDYRRRHYDCYRSLLAPLSWLS